MNRLTIDYGIDLGTSNSSIARIDGTSVEVFRNVERDECTPSVVHVKENGDEVVGRMAKERIESDPENTRMEFKRDMGTAAEYSFAKSGLTKKPEELSASVLKTLSGDVQRRNGEVLAAAVITVPADFPPEAVEATNRAAKLAGFHHTVLLTEPVAAAQAYSFDREDDNTFWLVYDFGGGTFDAAIIQVCDGLPQVVGHGGDNHLGGKDIDWAIVEQLFIPALTEKHRLTDFRRGAYKWNGAIGKLKTAAEKAKIRLSSADKAEVFVEWLCNDDNGDPVEFEFEVVRADLERLAGPYIRRSINICKETLASRSLAPGNIAKVLLVGGPTMMPLLRQLLADPKEGLGIELEHNVDPLTVVARGAAIFAAGQRLPEDGPWKTKVEAGAFAVKLDYAPLGPDTEPPVAGVVSAGEGTEMDFTGYTIELVNPDAQPPWRGGKTPLGPKGNFMTTVVAEKGKANNFQIELCDGTGAIQQLSPDRFTITVKVGPVGITLPHNIGVALADNTVKTFFEKDTALPARKTRRDLFTAVAIKRGEAGQLLRVLVVEGDKPRANRNRPVGTLKIPAEKVTRDVPAGSEIEVTIEMDQSRLITTRAFIPILDEEFEDVLSFGDKPVSTPEELASHLSEAKERLKGLRQQADAADDIEASIAIRRIDDECLVVEIERQVAASSGSEDALGRGQNLLDSLNSGLDDAEDALEWPALVAEAEKLLHEVRETVAGSKHVTEEDKRKLAILERETRDAIERRSPDSLRRRIEGLGSLLSDIELRNPGIWVGMLEALKERKSELTDPVLAEKLFVQGDRAIENNDVGGLKTAVRGLISLLPIEPRRRIESDVKA